MFSWFRRQKVNKTLRIWAAIAYGVMVIVNGLANALPLNGKNTGEISDAYPNLFAPAGFTFAIWGVIYVFLGAYVLYQLGLWGKGRKLNVQTIERITPWFIATSVINSLWIFSWHWEVMWLTVALMIALLVSLIMINRVLAGKSYNVTEHMVVKNAMSIYWGWISVATIANITTWLVSMQWDGFGIKPDTWMIGMLIIGALLALAVMRRYHNYAYGAVFVWAYMGILSKHVTTFDSIHQAVIGALWALLTILTIACGLAFHRAYTTQIERPRRAR